MARAARARGIRTVGMYSDPDATLPYLDDVDEAVSLPGDAATDTYLNIAALSSTPRGARTATRFIPGYGFLAENAEFAEQVTAAGLTFVGPPADCVAAMGSKVRAKELARKASVPVLPDAVITGDTADLARLGERVGYPAAGQGQRRRRRARHPPGRVRRRAVRQR